MRESRVGRLGEEDVGEGVGGDEGDEWERDWHWGGSSACAGSFYATEAGISASSSLSSSLSAISSSGS